MGFLFYDNGRQWGESNFRRCDAITLFIQPTQKFYIALFLLTGASKLRYFFSRSKKVIFFRLGSSLQQIIGVQSGGNRYKRRFII